ncbi:hypothetical protein M6D93_03770 [Jatrophihabitans telluris]|uniref:Uncharacterized protein n=1 Tax=Jatrophihabitans telluris TaxID=2038343 RepID=A0ABY4QZP3_9ACTN|nr:hypothetical protein [Jatrophihabitans telluris]UQX89126.1 hypothetical protein M6D93_03770 [Jatrophihabitans telluris]
MRGIRSGAVFWPRWGMLGGGVICLVFSVVLGVALSHRQRVGLPGLRHRFDIVRA